MLKWRYWSGDTHSQYLGLKLAYINMNSNISHQVLPKPNDVSNAMHTNWKALYTYYGTSTIFLLEYFLRIFGTGVPVSVCDSFLALCFECTLRPSAFMGVSAVMFQLRGPLEIPIQSLMWEWQPLFQQTHSAFTSYPTLPPPPPGHRRCRQSPWRDVSQPRLRPFKLVTTCV